MINRVFTPGASVKLACTAASARVAIPATYGSAGASEKVVMLYAAGNPVYVNFGTSVVEAVNNGTNQIIPAGGWITIGVPSGAAYIAGICDAALTATLFITTGTGL